MQKVLDTLQRYPNLIKHTSYQHINYDKTNLICYKYTQFNI